MIIKTSILAGITLAGAMLAMLTASQAATTYSAVGDFSSSNGGVWSYGYNVSNPLGSPTLLDQYIPNAFPGLDAWHNAGGNCCGGGTGNNSVLIAKNTTTGDLAYETIIQPNSYLEMDPEINASADLIFKAPVAGTYTISFSFLGIDTQAGNNNAGHPVDVLVNGGLTGFIGSINTYGASYSGTGAFFLGAGGTVDFQTLTSPNTFAYLSTGIQADISLSAVPLPASLPMFGGALLALAGFGYGMNRWVAPKAKTAA